MEEREDECMMIKRDIKVNKKPKVSATQIVINEITSSITEIRSLLSEIQREIDSDK